MLLEGVAVEVEKRGKTGTRFFFLLTKREGNDEVQKGKWEFSGGGGWEEED